MEHVWKSDDNFWVLVLFFDQIQVVGVGDNYLYTLTHLASPSICFYGNRFERTSSKK